MRFVRRGKTGTTKWFTLTSDIARDFQHPLVDVKAQTLFSIIQAHWSVNGGVAEREDQDLD
jgi:hypothetical protein